MPDQNHRFQLLLKEMDLIEANIKNLDDIIHKNKNFAIVIWGGALLLIARYLYAEDLDANIDIQWVIGATALVPLIFWIIHVQWQKYLNTTSERERMISFFINGPHFKDWLEGSEEVNFPLYDVPGWIYHKAGKRPGKPWEDFGFKVDEQYLLQHKANTTWRLMWYKRMGLYFLLMIVMSVVFALI